jgi:hypothetical protein
MKKGIPFIKIADHVEVAPALAGGRPVAAPAQSRLGPQCASIREILRQ